jgi:hypothetical protein
MGTKRLGKLDAQYQFLLNPYTDVRLSKCPRCNRLTHYRKFALFIHVNDWGPLVLGKTCRYCTPCELIMVHRDELESELERSAAPLIVRGMDRGYLVVGTVDRQVWQKWLNSNECNMGDIFAHMADFKENLELRVAENRWQQHNA